MTPPPPKKTVSFDFVLAECLRDSVSVSSESTISASNSEDDQDHEYFLEGIDPVFE